jgi:hypothetical protein
MRQPDFFARSLGLLLIAAAWANASVNHAEWGKPNPTPDIIGEATDLDSGKVIYRELHYCSDDQRSCTVLYRDGSGELIFSKQLDYSSSLQAPSLQLNDYQQGWEFSATSTDYGENFVVDAGFDNFIRLQWENFNRGESVRFPLLLAGRDKPYSMRAENQRRGDCPETQLCLRVRLDSWLLGKLVQPIDLVYARDSQRLLRYRGISNISLAGGGNPLVDISYRYSHQSGSSALQPGSE